MPKNAIDADGDFVVVWESNGSAATDSSGEPIQGQRYDADGNVVGFEFQVNTYTGIEPLIVSEFAVVARPGIVAVGPLRGARDALGTRDAR